MTVAPGRWGTTPNRLGDALLWTSVAVAVCGIVGPLQSVGSPATGTVDPRRGGDRLLRAGSAGRQPPAGAADRLAAARRRRVRLVVAGSWWAVQGLAAIPARCPCRLAAWLTVSLSPLPWPLVLVAPLVLFPNGRARSARWRCSSSSSRVVGTAGRHRVVALPVAIDGPSSSSTSPASRVARRPSGRSACGRRPAGSASAPPSSPSVGCSWRGGGLPGSNDASTHGPHRGLGGHLRRRRRRVRAVSASASTDPGARRRRSAGDPARRSPWPWCDTGCSTSACWSAGRCSSSSSACSSPRCTSRCSSCWRVPR